jgi:threonine synthase
VGRRSADAETEAGSAVQVSLAGVPQNLCVCGSPSLARYNVEALAAARSFDDMAARTPALWRHHEPLPGARPRARRQPGEA